MHVRESETSGPLVDAVLAGGRSCPAFLGVSIKNKMANRRALSEAIPWLQKHVSNGLILIGDYPHRHNLVALRGLSPHGALTKAIADGSRALRTARAIVDEIDAGSTMIVQSAADVIETAQCRSILRALSRYFDNGHVFVKDVLDAARDYTVRACPAFPRSHALKILPILKDYILEELAMFLTLYKTGYLVEVYLGPDLPIMRKIATGCYAGFPFKCPERTHISLDISGDNEREDTG